MLIVEGHRNWKRATDPVLPWVLTPEETERLHRSDATVAWLCRLPTEILHQFAGKWVAARDCQIIASGDTYEGLFAALEGVNLEPVVIHHITRPGVYIY